MTREKVIIDTEKFKELYFTKTDKELAEIFNVSKLTIINKARKLDLHKGSGATAKRILIIKELVEDYNNYTGDNYVILNKEEFIEIYKNKTELEAAKYLNVSINQIRVNKQYLGLHKHNKDFSNYERIQTYSKIQMRDFLLNVQNNKYNFSNKEETLKWLNNNE